ncbi:glycoside hydrolase family 78 protein [Saccharata proteae CBS 121410]|uniref:Glycoside hydrolase family 78 protein n=1 Tax=Saccharata proteae CBS 121410 TaxID=1314787 RepID=A0A9P4HLE8_9PEZI|nr:glycoside hydrolase family 78 protein [Saccharata proteae CBS 121410]
MSSPDWTNEANWVWLPDYNAQELETPGVFVLFRKNFHVENVDAARLESWIIHISADTRYRLLVNGIPASFGPCKSYLGRWYYETVDIARYLEQGDNVLAVRVLRYSPTEPGVFSWARANRPGLMVYGEGKAQHLSTNDSWRCKVDKSTKLVPGSEWNYILGPAFFQINEKVDTALTEKIWMYHEYDDSQWSSAVSQAKPKMLPVNDPWRLHERPIPMLPEKLEAFEGVVDCTGPVQRQDWDSFVQQDEHITIPAGSTISVDLQAAALDTGFLQLHFSGGANSSISILCAESYEKHLGVDTSLFPLPRQKGDRTDHVNGVLYGTTDYITIGPDRKLLEDFYETFWFRTFRYVRLSITCSDSPLMIFSFFYRKTHYPLDVQSSIFCSPTLDRIWETSKRTLLNCMHETYEDCPFYEQNQFISDSRLAMLFTYQLSYDDRLARKTIHEFYASRQENGLLDAQFPNPLGTAGMNIPQFSLYWIWMLHDHHRYFRSLPLIKRYLGAVDDILAFFDSMLNDQGLVGRFPPGMWPFVDWVKEWEQNRKHFTHMAIPDSYVNGGIATFNSLLYSYTLSAAADLAADASRNDTAAEYRKRAADLNDAVNRHCFHEGWYRDGSSPNDDVSQHSQIFAILSRATTGENAMNLLLRTFDAGPAVPRCSYALGFYVFEAAAQVGLLAQLMPRLIKPWEDMLAMNLTTWAENETNVRSDCHAWSSTPIDLVVRHIFGIEPSNGEDCDVVIQPNKKLLGDGARGTFATRMGRVKIIWGIGASDGSKASSLTLSDFVVSDQAKSEGIGSGASGHSLSLIQEKRGA